MSVKVTENERRMLVAILHSEFQDARHPVLNAVWSFSVCESHADAGTLGSLKKKGLIGGDGAFRDDDATCWLTEAGAETIREEIAAYLVELGHEPVPAYPGPR